MLILPSALPTYVAGERLVSIEGAKPSRQQQAHAGTHRHVGGRTERGIYQMTIDEKIEDYRKAIKSCIGAGFLLTEYKLPEILAAINQAEATGPMLNPTLFREKAQALREDKELLKAAMPLYNLVQRRIDEVTQLLREGKTK